MDTPMAVSREKIKALRDARAWSQAHLAEAASLSLRTVQRVEAEGTASAETRLALAAALGVSVDELNAPVAAAAVAADDPPVESSAGLPLVFGCSAVALVFVLWVGRGLPPVVASHFGVAGDANGTMSRDNFIAVMVLMATVLPTLMHTGLTLAFRRGKVNIPSARYWLAPERRADTQRWLHRHMTWVCVGVSALTAWLTWMVAVANRVSPPAPDSRWMLAGLVTLLAAATVWLVVLQRRFARSIA